MEPFLNVSLSDVLEKLYPKPKEERKEEEKKSDDEKIEL